MNTHWLCGWTDYTYAHTSNGKEHTTVWPFTGSVDEFPDYTHAHMSKGREHTAAWALTGSVDAFSDYTHTSKGSKHTAA